jgi:hypothetical protein
MLNKCSNPECEATFRFLHEGRLFRFMRGYNSDSRGLHEVEYFWLCDNCCSRYTLAWDRNAGLVVAETSDRNKDARVILTVDQPQMNSVGAGRAPAPWSRGTQSGRGKEGVS